VADIEERLDLQQNTSNELNQAIKDLAKAKLRADKEQTSEESE